MGQSVAFDSAMQKTEIVRSVGKISQNVNDPFAVTDLDKIIQIYDSIPDTVHKSIEDAAAKGRASPQSRHVDDVRQGIS